MASTFLYRTNGTASSTTKYTLAFWIKKCANAVDMRLFNNYADSNNNGAVYFDASNDYLNVVDKIGGSTHSDMSTSRQFRDVNGYYHIVIAVDTTQGSSSDRCKIYVNGVQETSFATSTYPSSSANLGFQQATGGDNCRIGSHNGDGDYINAVLSHVHYTDGYAYAASDFGEEDASTGEWKIKTSPSVSYGTNGYFVLKDGAVMTDSSPNSNDFSKNGAGTLTQTEDCPSNVFATNNPLVKQQTTYAMQYGNTWCRTTDAAMFCASSTLGMTKGKFYAEVKCGTIEASSRGEIGISGDVGKMSRTNDYVGGATDSYSYASNGAKMEEGTETGYGDSWTTGDIISIAYDADNNKLYFAKNGVWQDSGDPTSGSTGTGALSIEAPSNTVDGVFFFACGDNSTGGSTTTEYNWNYGNGYFGTSAISSEGTNASGIGKFEFNVPAGYTALSTKGLNE